MCQGLFLTRLWLLLLLRLLVSLLQMVAFPRLESLSKRLLPGLYMMLSSLLLASLSLSCPHLSLWQLSVALLLGGMSSLWQTMLSSTLLLLALLALHPCSSLWWLSAVLLLKGNSMCGALFPQSMSLLLILLGSY